MLLSNKVYFGKKDIDYFIGYRDGKKVRPLSVMLPKMGAHRKNFDETKYMYFLIEMTNCQKIVMKFSKKSVILLKKNFIVKLFTIKSIYQLK